MQRQPLLIVLIFFILGIVFQNYFPFSLLLNSVLIVLSFLIILIGFLKTKLKYKHGGIFLLFFFLGCFITNIQTPEEPKNIISSTDVITFKIDKKLNSNQKNKKYEALVYHNKNWLKSIVLIPKDLDDLDYSHYYRGKGFINTIDPPTHQYQFNYYQYLARQDIFYQIYFGEPLEKSSRTDLSIAEKIKQFRLELLHKINEVDEFTVRNQELLKGIILADRTDMDAETVQNFNKTGLVHILAISGSHMVIIFGLVFTLLSLFIHNKKQVIVFALLFIWVFTILIDFGNSVVRSSIMITMYYAYILLDRKPDLVHSLSLSGLLILIYNPFQLFDVGFQLSFAAVLGIYWLNKPIQSLLPIFSNVIFKYCKNIISITLSAQLATLPLVIYYFHQFPIISLFSNLIAIPIAEAVIIGGLIMTILIGFGFDFLILNSVYNFICTFFLYIVEFFAQFETFLIKNIPLNSIEVFILTIILFQLRYFLVSRTVRNRNRMIFLILLFISSNFIFNNIAYNRSESIVHTMFNDRIISSKTKDKVVFYIPENVDYKRVEQFIILPYIVNRRVKNYQTIFVKDDIVEIIINDESFATK